ncbi:uncharacterized protein LOC114288838 [Camellia sinensis]|uniref:uncharacterized protein LOC114288838 n=1 Tax=Camellia sinensis TaxID=4442 RepID=UPI001036D4BF|nr:uncharacterized protein LOC114288838 [Camellia sinensis]
MKNTSSEVEEAMEAQRGKSYKWRPNLKGGQKWGVYITSLLLIDEQEKLDSKDWSKTQQENKLLFYANHKKKTRAMLDYYKLQGSYDHLDQNDRGLRRRKSKVAAAVATTIAIVIALVGTEEEDEEVGGGGGVATHRRLWVKNRSQAWWDECKSAEFPEEEFMKGFKMGNETFEMICNELSSAIDRENTSLRDIVPVRQRVYVCIWRLATGEPFRPVSQRFGLGISTCHKLILEVCSAIRTVLMPEYLQWPDEESVKRVKEHFISVSGIPNVVGSMYTTHCHERRGKERIIVQMKEE